MMRTVASSGGAVENSSIFTTSMQGLGYPAGAATRYSALVDSYAAPAAEAAAQQVIRRAGTLRNLYVSLNIAPGAGSRTFTLMVNGVATALTVTIAGVATNGNDTDPTHAVAVVPGDLVDVRMVSIAGTAGSTATIATEFVAGTTNFATMLKAHSGGTVGAAQDYYIQPMGGYEYWSAPNEYRTQQIVPRDGVLRNFRVDLSAAPGAGASYTITVRINGANTLLSVTIANLNTYGENIAVDVAVNAGDLLSIYCDAVGFPVASYKRATLEWHPR